jgi:hypothetical protein
MIVSGEIWRELCLSCHWIQDAVILCWGELTCEISGKAISPSKAIERRLRVPEWKPNIEDARRVNALPSKECVWTGGALGLTFDVGLVQPFSL